MESSAIRAYEIFRKRFSSEEAETIMAWKDEHLAKWVASKDDVYTVKEDIAALDMKIASVRTELKEDIANLREGIVRMEARLETSFAKSQNSTIRWFITTALAMTGVLAGIMFAMMKLMI